MCSYLTTLNTRFSECTSFSVGQYGWNVSQQTAFSELIKSQGEAQKRERQRFGYRKGRMGLDRIMCDRKKQGLTLQHSLKTSVSLRE